MTQSAPSATSQRTRSIGKAIGDAYRVCRRAAGVPQGWLLILIVAQVTVWTVVPWLLATSLPLDVVSDGLAWGHEWQWGYYKHPPLPSWAVELFFDALGDIGPFLLSQIAIAATYVCVFLLGREFMPPRWAAVGALLLVGVYYFSIPSPEFNHNVAQMPVWAAASLAYYRSLKTRRLHWWLALGMAAGIGLLTKYSTGVLLAAMMLHVLSARRTRTVFASAGPYVALGACLAVVSAHIAWLIHNGYSTLDYAVARAGHARGLSGRFLTPLKFLGAQFIDISPAVAMAGAMGLFGRETVRRRRFVDDEDMRFLVFLTLGPPALAASIAAAASLGMRDMWGAPMWNLTGLLVVHGTRSRWKSASLRRLAIALIGLFCAGIIGYVLATSIVPERQNTPSRTQWPDRDLAETFSRLWVTRMHRPVDIVAGDGWLAGLIAMRTDPRPSVWISGSYKKSPWITPRRVAREGALVVWQERTGNPARAPVLSLPGLRIMGVEMFAWPNAPKARPLRVGWGVVPPTGVR